MAAMQLVLQVVTGYMASAVLHPILKLGVPDLLAKGPRTVAELAQATGAHEDTLYRVMRTLSGVGLFEEAAPHRFALTAAGAFLRSDVPGSVRDLAVFICDPFHFRMYAEMMHSVMTGKSAAEKFLGMPMFEYLPRDPELSESFNRAMTGFSAAVIPAVLKTFDFSGIDVLVDVAGGHGEVLGSILKQHPQMRGVLFDLDHVIAGAVPHLQQMGVKARCDAVAGNFFTSVPAGGDAYIMKHIIHDWDDDRASALLGNIRRALDGKPNGRVLLIEAVIQPGNEPDVMKMIDMEMLAAPGGRERTVDEFKALFARSGFELTRIVPNESPLALIEARVR